MYSKEQIKRMMENLAAKEKRAERQREWINKYRKPIISLTLNIPGEVKVTPSYKKVLDIIIKELNRDLYGKIMEDGYYESPLGNYYIAAIEMDSLDLKKYCIKLEEEDSIGRILDLDVFNEDGKNISRRELQLEQRKCILCDKEARICIRENNHALEDLVERVEDLVFKFLGENNDEEKN